MFADQQLHSIILIIVHRMPFKNKLKSAFQYEQSCSSHSSSTLGKATEILQEEEECRDFENDYGNDHKAHYYTPNKPTLPNEKSYSLRKLSPGEYGNWERNGGGNWRDSNCQGEEEENGKKGNKQGSSFQKRGNKKQAKAGSSLRFKQHAKALKFDEDERDEGEGSKKQNQFLKINVCETDLQDNVDCHKGSQHKTSQNILNSSLPEQEHSSSDEQSEEYVLIQRQRSKIPKRQFGILLIEKRRGFEVQSPSLCQIEEEEDSRFSLSSLLMAHR